MANCHYRLEGKQGKFCFFFQEKKLHYKLNNYHMTKNIPIYHARNVNRWKGSVKPRPFIGLLIFDVINRFIFCHGVVIYYVLEGFMGCKLHIFEVYGAKSPCTERIFVLVMRLIFQVAVNLALSHDCLKGCPASSTGRVSATLNIERCKSLSTRVRLHPGSICLGMFVNGLFVCVGVLRPSQQLRSCRGGELSINTVPGQA